MVSSCDAHGKGKTKTRKDGEGGRWSLLRATATKRLRVIADGRANTSAGLFPRFRTRLMIVY